jgi:hypothetical protein
VPRLQEFGGGITNGSLGAVDRRNWRELFRLINSIDRPAINAENYHAACGVRECRRLFCKHLATGFGQCAVNKNRFSTIIGFEFELKGLLSSYKIVYGAFASGD